jgi:hypothetical protein
MHTVHSLRKLGCKVKVLHYREYESDLTCQLAARGGSTVVEVYLPKQHFGFVGVAKCSPVDNYDRKIGVKIALGRALFAMGAM